MAAEQHNEQAEEEAFSNAAKGIVAAAFSLRQQRRLQNRKETQYRRRLMAVAALMYRISELEKRSTSKRKLETAGP